MSWQSIKLDDKLTANIKHFMTGPEGNSYFCFQRISMFPEGSQGKHQDSSVNIRG